MSKVKFGSARISETGGINGAKGDQKNGAEVSIQDFYMSSKGWLCLRAKDEREALKLAQAMEDACNNDPYLGYGQNDRLDIIIQVKAGKKLKDINVPTNCDCSSLVRACIIEAMGIDVGNFNTSSEVDCILKSGKFTKETINSERDCKIGDILVTKTKGHTVICVHGYSRSARSLEIIAQEVIEGKWGNGEARREKLASAGYNYLEVQRIVNTLLKR